MPLCWRFIDKVQSSFWRVHPGDFEFMSSRLL
jgi:hypothetical protein